jgi:hypothetical protein
MKPVQQVFGLRSKIQLHVPHVLATIREELHLLIHLQPLRAQHFAQSAPGFFIVGLHKSEALAGKFFLFSSLPPESQQALAGDHFEMSLFISASYNAHRQWTIRLWKLVPIPLAAFDKGPLLLP